MSVLRWASIGLMVLAGLGLACMATMLLAAAYCKWKSHEAGFGVDLIAIRTLPQDRTTFVHPMVFFLAGIGVCLILLALGLQLYSRAKDVSLERRSPARVGERGEVRNTGAGDAR